MPSGPGDVFRASFIADISSLSEKAELYVSSFVEIKLSLFFSVLVLCYKKEPEQLADEEWEAIVWPSEFTTSTGSSMMVPLI